MNRSTIGLVWLGGIALMLVLYAVGPLHFLDNLDAFLWNSLAFMDRLLATLAYQALDAMRAAAIALYVVFVVLAVLARRRGLRAEGMLVMVSIAFLILAGTDWYAQGPRWTAAALLAGVGAAVMTSRLLHPPPPRAPGHRAPWSQRPVTPDADFR